jgi:hypothetical protein
MRLLLLTAALGLLRPQSAAASCALDSTFNAGGYANGQVHAILVEPSPSFKVLMGGSFTVINGTTRTYFARLNADGTVDPGVSVVLNGPVYAIAREPGGLLWLGGAFTTVNGANSPYLVRLKLNFQIASFFSPDGPVYALAIQPDGKILVGGNFNYVNGVGSRGFVRINNSNNAIEPVYNYPYGPVYSISVNTIPGSPNYGKIYVGGEFEQLAGPLTRKRVMRYNSSLYADTTFDAGSDVNGTVYAVNCVPWNNFNNQDEERIMIGGDFSYGGSVRLAQLYPDGQINFNVNLQYDNTVKVIAVQPSILPAERKLLIGGCFTTANSYSRGGLVRLLMNQSMQAPVDTDWNPCQGATGCSPTCIQAASYQGSRIIAGGCFGYYDNVFRPYFAGLHRDP